MSHTTGLSLVSIEENCVHVRLRQDVPIALDAYEGEHRGQGCNCSTQLHSQLHAIPRSFAQSEAICVLWQIPESKGHH